MTDLELTKACAEDQLRSWREFGRWICSVTSGKAHALAMALWQGKSWEEAQKAESSADSGFLAGGLPLPRYLVYDIDKHQTSPHFTDNLSEHNGTAGNLDVVVDLHTGKRKAFDEWAPVEGYNTR